MPDPDRDSSLEAELGQGLVDPGGLLVVAERDDEVRNARVLLEGQGIAELRVIGARGAGKFFGAQLEATDAGRVVHHRAERQIDLARLEHPGVATARRRHDRELDTGCFALDDAA